MYVSGKQGSQTKLVATIIVRQFEISASLANLPAFKVKLFKSLLTFKD